MKKFLFILAFSGIFIGCKNEKTQITELSQAEPIAVNYQTFGDKITDEAVLTKSQMTEKFKNLKPGDTVDAKFSSTVQEVCQQKGCWMKMDLDKEEAMIRFKDYGFFMPKDIAGQKIIVAGKAFVEEMSVEDQQHYAEDGGKSEEEIAQITEPKFTYAFEANGVLIPEVEKE